MLQRERKNSFILFILNIGDFFFFIYINLVGNSMKWCFFIGLIIALNFKKMILIQNCI